MTEDEKYLFDLNGYLVIENVLTDDELALANEAVDRHLDQGHIRSRVNSAGNMAYVRAYDIPEWANERQRAVMEPPYHTRLNRPTLKE